MAKGYARVRVVRIVALVLYCLGLLLGCGEPHVAVVATPSAQVSQPSSLERPTDAPFVFRDADLRAEIDMPAQTTCVAFSVEPVEGAPCELPPGSADGLQRSGALLALISIDDAGMLVFTASVLEQKFEIKDRNEFARGMVDSNANARWGTALVENRRRADTIKLSENTVIERFSFDGEVRQTTQQPELAYKRLVHVAVPGRRGLYGLSWAATESRGEEAEAIADRTIAALRRTLIRH